MSDRLIQLAANLEKVLGQRAVSIEIALGEVTVVVKADTYFESAMLLRDDPSLAFEQLIDLCGVDYQDYRDGAWSGQRFGVVSHLLSLQHNWRLRVRVFAPDDTYPLVASITQFGIQRTGLNVKHSIFMAFCLKAMMTCVVS
jgi:NADH-quinone oxidoreductase subunit C